MYKICKNDIRYTKTYITLNYLKNNNCNNCQYKISGLCNTTEDLFCEYNPGKEYLDIILYNTFESIQLPNSDFLNGIKAIECDKIVEIDYSSDKKSYIYRILE
jgi:hypothetical protein